MCINKFEFLAVKVIKNLSTIKIPNVSINPNASILNTIFTIKTIVTDKKNKPI